MKYKEIITKIFDGYPRQIGLPKRKDVKNYKELISIINKWNQKQRIFVSLYKYSFENTRDFILDKVWFDFDDYGYENVMILHNWLSQKNLAHFIVFSGRGYHCYILTDKKELKNNKVALINVHNSIINETKIMVDRQIIGDIARIVGIPGTYNTKRKRWCIFVDEDMLGQGHNWIKSYAEEEQIGKFSIYGRKLLSLKEYDTGIPEYEIEAITVDNLIEKINEDEILKKLKPCVAKILLSLNKLEHSYNERFIVMTHLISEGYSENDIEKILKKFMNIKKFKHCIKNERQLKYLYRRIILPPSCLTIKQKGYCELKKTCKFIR